MAALFCFLSVIPFIAVLGGASPWLAFVGAMFMVLGAIATDKQDQKSPGG